MYSVSTVETSLTQLPDAGYCRGQMGKGVHDHLGIPRIPAPAENPGYIGDVPGEMNRCKS